MKVKVNITDEEGKTNFAKLTVESFGTGLELANAIVELIELHFEKTELE